MYQLKKHVNQTVRKFLISKGAYMHPEAIKKLKKLSADRPYNYIYQIKRRYRKIVRKARKKYPNIVHDWMAIYYAYRLGRGRWT